MLDVIIKASVFDINKEQYVFSFNASISKEWIEKGIFPNTYDLKYNCLYNLEPLITKEFNRKYPNKQIDLYDAKIFTK